MIETQKKKQSSWWKWAASGVLCAVSLLLVLGSIKAPLPSSAKATPAPVVTAQSSLDERESRYQADIAALERLVAQEKLDEASRADAAAQLRVLVERHQSEAQLTAALRAAGYQDPLVILENGSLTVALTETELTDGGRVLSLCLSHAPVEARNVRIITGRAE